MADAVDFGGVADDAVGGVGEEGDDAGHAFAVGGEGFFLDELVFLAAGEGFVDDAALGFADLFDEARGEEGVAMDVHEVHELVLDGGAAGVDDEDFHDAGGYSMDSGQIKEPGF